MIFEVAIRLPVRFSSSIQLRTKGGAGHEKRTRVQSTPEGLNKKRHTTVEELTSQPYLSQKQRFVLSKSETLPCWIEEWDGL